VRRIGLQTCASRRLLWYNFGMKNSAARDAFLAIAAVIAALVPFLNKAFHIDDPLFLWMAQQVSQLDRSQWVLRELVRKCQADVFDHAESPSKRLLHRAGREVSRLELSLSPRLRPFSERFFWRNVCRVHLYLERFLCFSRPSSLFRQRP